jgi:adenylosuccinate synthase
MNKLGEYRKKLRSLDLEVHIVLGSTFGDEGKGVTTQWLAKRAIGEGKKPCVIRFSGGPQAGHTILEGGVKHICSSFGSGVLLGIPTYIAGGSNTFIDPISMKMEKDDLVKKLGKEVEYPWWDLFGPRIITPMDVLAGRNDSKVLSDGTCGKGIYSTWKRYKNNVGCGINSMCSVADLKNGKYWDDILKYYGQVDESNYKDLFMEAATDIVGDENANRCMTPDRNNHYCFPLGLFMQNYDVLIFEGSQGLLLDMDCGFYPNVTPSKTGLNGIPRNIFGDSPLCTF